MVELSGDLGLGDKAQQAADEGLSSMTFLATVRSMGGAFALAMVHRS